MFSFANDYSEGACPEVLNNLVKTNNLQSEGYGVDEYCRYAAKLIKEKVGSKDCDVHFITGGTPCNVIAISLLKSYEAVICAEGGHINVHETGAVEATGHKILTVKGRYGKVTAPEIEQVVLNHLDEHMVKPKMVFISNPSELGTIYSKQELYDIACVCHKYRLYLYVDGARLANALVANGNDLTLKDIYDYADLFYIGGTKNGALLGEAMIVKNPELRPNFRYAIKQHNAMLAKGRVIGVQFATLFTDDLYLKNAANAVNMAQALKTILIQYHVPMYIDSPTNQIFPVFDDRTLARIKEKYIVTDWGKIDNNHTIVRMVCSWATTKDSIKQFLYDFSQIIQTK